MKTILLLVLALFAWNPCFSAYSSQPKCPDSQLPFKKGICTSYTTMYLKPDSNVSFPCPLIGPSYVFYKIAPGHTKMISPVKSKYIMSGNNLEITKLGWKDAGQYMCEVKNTTNNGNVSRSYWFLFLLKQKRANVTGKLVNREQPIGGEVVFHCPKRIYRGRKSPNQLLYRSLADAKPQVVSRSRLQHNKNGMYKLSPVVPQDAGFYYCGYKTAVGRFELVKALVHLEVRDLPKILGGNKNKDVLVGRSIHLVCQYQGPQSISWYKDGKEVTIGVQLKQLDNHTKALTLFRKVVKKSDAGDYECRVTIGGKLVKQHTKLKVYDLPQIPDSSKNKDVWLGKSAHLMCQYKGPQIVSWYKDGKKITNGVRSINIDKHWKSIELFLKRATESDAGDYQCRVTIGGKMGQQHTKLGVYRFSIGTKGIEGEMVHGGMIYINCSSCNSIQATYSLLHRPFNSTTYTEVNKSRYIFYQHLPRNIFIFADLKRKDEGFYKCKATLNGESIEDQPNAMWLDT